MGVWKWEGDNVEAETLKYFYPNCSSDDSRFWLFTVRFSAKNSSSLSSYLPTFKFQKEEQMREKKLKRGTFLNFLYITIQRLLQKQEHMIKSFSFLLRKEELLLQKRNSWQVCLISTKKCVEIINNKVGVWKWEGDNVEAEAFQYFYPNCSSGDSRLWLFTVRFNVKNSSLSYLQRNVLK